MMLRVRLPVSLSEAHARGGGRMIHADGHLSAFSQGATVTVEVRSTIPAIAAVLNLRQCDQGHTQNRPREHVQRPGNATGGCNPRPLYLSSSNLGLT